MTKKPITAARYEEGTKTIRSVPENYWLASMDSWDSATDHDRNAKVMAASFELLAAAKRALVVLEGLAVIRSPDDALGDLAAAIVKAEG